jgi:hypothetical protein
MIIKNIKIFVASHSNELYLMGLVDGNCRVEIYVLFNKRAGVFY